MRSGTPNSRRQTSASTAMPSRIACVEGLAKQSRNRLMSLVRRPFGARINGDARRERSLRELWRIDRVGQLDPEKDAAPGLGELGPRAEMLVKGVHQRVELGLQGAREFGHVLGETARAHLAQDHLLERA